MKKNIRKRNRNGNRSTVCSVAYGVVSSVELRKMVQTGKLIPAPIRHQALTPSATERARQAYARVGYLIYPTFEQWETGFRRDMHPEREIAIWEAIADTLDAYKTEKPDNDKETLKKRLRIVIAVSLGGRLRDETPESRRLRKLFHNFWSLRG